MADLTGHGRLLVVDDDPRNRMLLSDILRGAGYDVMEARDGAEALRMLSGRQGPFDLVLLDMQMPRVDGFTVARAIRKEPSLDHLAILAVTAMDGPEDAMDALRAGCDAYLAKPISIPDVRELVAGLLEGAGEPVAVAAAGEAASAPVDRGREAPRLLATIVGLAELLGRSEALTGADREYARQLQGAAERLRRALVDPA